MAITRTKKEEVLATLEAHLKDATSIAFTSNQRLTVLETMAMKRELRAQNTVFMLAKKTLIRIAFQNILGQDLDIDTLPGQVAIIISKGDKVAGLSVVNKFANEREFKKAEKIKFVGGFFDGKIVGAEEIAKIASLPSREVLLAKLLGSMMSPLSGLARFFDGAKTELETQGKKKVGDLQGTSKDTPKAAEEVVAQEAPAATEEAPAEATPAQ